MSRLNWFSATDWLNGRQGKPSPRFAEFVWTFGRQSVFEILEHFTCTHISKFACYSVRIDVFTLYMLYTGTFNTDPISNIIISAGPFGIYTLRTKGMEEGKNQESIQFSPTLDQGPRMVTDKNTRNITYKRANGAGNKH